MQISEADRDWINKRARELADIMADLLQQEYTRIGGVWWLWSLGRAMRPLTDEKIAGGHRWCTIPQGGEG